jgi:hypothetical protein
MLFRVPLWACLSKDFRATRATPGGEAIAELVVLPLEEREVVAA